MSRFRWVAPVALPLALVAGCGTTSAGPGGGAVLVAEGVSRVEPAADSQVGPAVTGMTKLGYDLLRAMETDADGNVVLSPLSIAYAFGMAEAGAAGDTRKQIDATFGFPGGGPHAPFNLLTRQVGAQDTPPPRTPPTTLEPGERHKPRPPILAIANGLFVQHDYPVKQDFLRTLAEQYGAGARTVDFGGSSGDAANVINDWVQKQTADRIEKLFDRLDPDTRLVLANAVYLKADWASSFERSATEDKPFHLAGGRNVTVPMMSQQASLGYAKGDGWQAVELPYADSDLAMWVLLPIGSSEPLDLLAPATMAEVGNALRPKRVDLTLPRWDFGKDDQIALGTVLPRLGMTLPFDRNRADFSGMTDTEKLYIAQAVHRANITVDEDGTEAAAVTGIAIEPDSADPGPEVTVRADRPFAFAVVHKPTGAPLFIGQVADPTQK